MTKIIQKNQKKISPKMMTNIGKKIKCQKKLTKKTAKTPIDKAFI